MSGRDTCWVVSSTILKENLQHQSGQDLQNAHRIPRRATFLRSWRGIFWPETSRAEEAQITHWYKADRPSGFLTTSPKNKPQPPAPATRDPESASCPRSGRPKVPGSQDHGDGTGATPASACCG